MRARKCCGEPGALSDARRGGRGGDGEVELNLRNRAGPKAVSGKWFVMFCA